MSIQTQDPKPFHRALTRRAAAARGLACVAGKFGQSLPYENAEVIVGAAADLIFALGAFGVGLGRARARSPLA